jgi:predicted DNA-binding transcriptional regulator AlpA
MCSECRGKLVGMAQIQPVLAVSRNRAYTITRDRDFPEPVYESARFRVWCRSDVEAWLDENRPTWREESSLD